MIEQEVEVYGKIYNELKNYMERRGQTLPVSKGVFLRSLGHRANCVDMSGWENLSDSDFIDISYLELLRRFPFETDKEYWMHEPDNKKKLIQTIIKSGEFINLHINIINNPYPIDERKFYWRQKLYTESYDHLSRTWYYRLYMKFPIIIRRFLKKAVGI